MIDNIPIPTVLPAKSDSYVMFCLQTYQGLIFDRSGSKLFAKITTRRQKSLLAMKELMFIAKNLYTRNVLTLEMFNS